VGAEVELQTLRGPVRRRVAAVAVDYSAGGMSLYMSWGPARDLFGFREPHALEVVAAPSERETLTEALAGYCRRRELGVERNEDFEALIDRVVAGVRALMVGLVGLVCLVAALGVVNTLTTNVLDQTRELGVLRALGLRRGQVARLVLSQAALLAAVSAVPGVLVG